ncbi:MAG TPA: glycosyltransferase family 1 protein [Microbacteriaceae bacterium]|nr:glycosyltransferase family 1 protein [Microbacteriaceae bacterium]
MSTLRVIVDQLLSPVPGGIGRYAAELTRALIETAPPGRDVAGVVTAAEPAALARVQNAVPGLAEIVMLPTSRRALTLAWQLGAVSAAALPPGSATHATSQLAPLTRKRAGSTVVATIHDTVPWTHPETLTRYGAQWHRAMGRRAARWADAIVVPTHAVAAELDAILHLGDRVRVIGGATSSTLALHADADVDLRAAALGLPPAYILAVGTLEPRKGLDALIAAMAHPDAPALPLVVAGPAGWGGIDLAELAARAGLAPERLLVLGRVDDADLAVAYARATAYCAPSRAEGFGLPVVEAMGLGTPVVHSDAPALAEVAGGAGLSVPLAPAASYPARLAAALRRVAEEPGLAAQLAAAGRERATAFSWTSSARAVWALHADLR